MRTCEIAPGIHNVGVSDWNIDEFHGYSTPYGTTYNAFLVIDGATVTLIDTVKRDHVDQLLANIAAVVDPARIDAVVSNHTEMDHSGGLPALMTVIGAHKPVYCSKMGLKNLAQHFHSGLNLQAVSNGQRLPLDGRSLTFLETRMLHWPDSMFSFMPEEGLLFSSDAFGQHYAGPERFDDEIGEAAMPHARKYFANILLPFSPRILKLVEQIGQLNLDIRTVCPDHGIVWRRDPAAIIRAYERWAHQTPRASAVLFYDTMWRSTAIIAEAIADGLLAENVAVHPMCLKKWHRSDIMTSVLDAGLIVGGSPTLNNGLYPTISDLLTYMGGLRPKHKLAAAFGSYGWSGEAVGQLNTAFEKMRFTLADPGLKIQYVPDEASRRACFDWGRHLAGALRSALAAT